MITALSAVALIVAAPAAFARGASGKTPSQPMVSRKHHPGVFGYAARRQSQSGGSKTGYAGALGHAPGAPGGSGGDVDASRQAGGGM